MDDNKYKKECDRRFELLSDEFLERCKEHLLRALTPELQEKIKKAYREHGDKWIFTMGSRGHFGIGVALRNYLRLIYKDYELPEEPKNWDDYYIGVVEYALGLRKKDR